MEEQREYQWCSAGPGRMISAENKIQMNSTKPDTNSMAPPVNFFSSANQSKIWKNGINLHWVYIAVWVIFPLWKRQYKNNQFCRMQQQLLHCCPISPLQRALDQTVVNWKLIFFMITFILWPLYLSNIKTKTENMINIWIPIEKQNAAVEDWGTSNKRYIFSLQYYE